MPTLTPTTVLAMLEAATPGPWTWFLRPRRMRLHHAESESASLTVLETAGHAEDYDTDYPGASRPDRDLIAAAPDLARALLEAWEERDAARAEVADLEAGVAAGRRAAKAAAEMARDLQDIGRMTGAREDEWPHYAVQRVIEERDEARAMMTEAIARQKRAEADCDQARATERARVVAYGRAIERSLRGPQWTLAQASAIGVLMDDIEAGVHTEEDHTDAR